MNCRVRRFVAGILLLVVIGIGLMLVLNDDGNYGCMCNVGSYYLYENIFKKDDVRMLNKALRHIPLNGVYSIYGAGISGAKARKSKQSSETLIMLASMANATNCLVELISRGSDLSIRTTRGSGLHTAAFLEPSSAIKLAGRIMRESDVQINEVDLCGRTALWWALKRNNLKYAEWLASKGARLEKTRFDKSINATVKYTRDVAGFPFDSFEFAIKTILKEKCSEPIELNEILLNIPVNDTSFEKKISELKILGADMNFSINNRTLMHKIILSFCDNDLKIRNIHILHRMGFSDKNLEEGCKFAQKHKMSCADAIESYVRNKTLLRDTLNR